MIFMFIVGILSGVISGLGIGGGTILIPALTIFMGMDQKVAQYLNLIYFIPTALIAVFVHLKNKNIEKNLLPSLIIFGVLGASVGSFIAINLGSDLLKKFFAIFLLVMGIIEFRKKEN